MEYEIVPQTIEAFLFAPDPLGNFHMEVLEVLEIHNLEVEMIHLGGMQIGTGTKNT